MFVKPKAKRKRALRSFARTISMRQVVECSCLSCCVLCVVLGGKRLNQKNSKHFRDYIRISLFGSYWWHRCTFLLLPSKQDIHSSHLLALSSQLLPILQQQINGGRGESVPQWLCLYRSRYGDMYTFSVATDLLTDPVCECIYFVGRVELLGGQCGHLKS